MEIQIKAGAGCGAEDSDGEGNGRDRHRGSAGWTWERAARLYPALRKPCRTGCKVISGVPSGQAAAF